MMNLPARMTIGGSHPQNSETSREGQNHMIPTITALKRIR